MIAVKKQFCKMPLNRQRRNMIWHIIGDGMLVPREWLLVQKALKLTGHAIDKLLKSKELYSVSKGIYCKGGTNPTWQTVIYSLQHYFNIDVVAGTNSIRIGGLWPLHSF